MSASTATAAGRPSSRALKALVASESKLAWREPVGLVLGVAFPVMLLVIFGLSSGFQKRIVATNPTTYRTRYPAKGHTADPLSAERTSERSIPASRPLTGFRQTRLPREAGTAA